MKINDGSIKVLVVDYGQPNNPNYVTIGYKFQDSPYSIKDFIDIVSNLNESAGWHFRDTNVDIMGTMYTVATVYEEERALKEVYPLETIIDQNLMNSMFQSFLPSANLGIPSNLMTYTVQRQEPKNETPQTHLESQPSSASKYLEYLTEEELAGFGDLNHVSDEDLDRLESLYEDRKGESMQRSLVKYELPQELSNYNLTYREAVLSKSIVAENNETPEELEAMKHELGLRSVVEDMLQEIPKTENIDASEGDEFLSSYKHLGSVLDMSFERGGINPATGAPTPVELDAQSIFQEQSINKLREIRNKYGSYTNFIDEYLKMGVGAEILPPTSIQHRSVMVEYRTIKIYDNNGGFSIGFTQQTDEGEYIFPLALFELVATMEENGRLLKGRTFSSTYNALVDEFCKEVRRTGLNTNKIKLSSHEVETITCSYLGSCVDEGQVMYLFRKTPESPERFFLINEISMGNKLFGSKYVLLGDNFQVNYLGERIVIAPIGEVIIKTTDEVYALIDEKSQNVVDPYPGYYTFYDFKTINEVENSEYRRVIESYEELLPKTWGLGYTWNTDLTDRAQPTTQTVQTQQPVQTTQPVQPDSNVVDIFATQPAGVFKNTPTQQAEVVERDENGLLLNPNFRNPEEIKDVVERMNFILLNKVEGETILSNYLIGHISILHGVGDYLGLGMTYVTDPERPDNQLDRHEIKINVVERIIGRIKSTVVVREGDELTPAPEMFGVSGEDQRVGEASKKQTDQSIEHNTDGGQQVDIVEVLPTKLENINNIYQNSSREEQEKIDMMLDFVTEFINKKF